MVVIDLRSDIVTNPTNAMREAMAEPKLGNDVFMEDPIVQKLQEYAANIFGKEAALCFPSGTMGNLASVMSHCHSRGSEVLLGDLSHMHIFEQGSMSQIAGVHPRTVSTAADGTLPVTEIIKKFRVDNVHQPETALICLENTHNLCGGTVLPISYLEEVGQVAKSKGVPIHVDGARIFNAAVHLGIPVSDILKDCDSVSSCLSKGLGAPIGTVVAGGQKFINKIQRCRKALGGGMRMGVMAAAGYVALTTMVERLADDHRRALNLAQAIKTLESDAVYINMATVQTNILIIQVNLQYWTAQEFCQRLKESTEREQEVLGDIISVLVCSFGDLVRIVFHSEVGDDETALAIQKIVYVLQEISHDL